MTEPSYSRASPSPRYRELVALYRRMHEEGDAEHEIPPEETFPGKSLPPHAVAIGEMIAATGARSLLDYGAGKGRLYEARDIELPGGRRVESLAAFWGLEAIVKYDPAYAPFSAPPVGQFDGVVCTDVLEHCPEPDIPWIVEELFAYARSFVYAGVACHPAKKLLPNGENAHCTVRPPDWWRDLVEGIAARHPGVRYRFALKAKAARKPLFGLLGKPRKSWTVLEGGPASGQGDTKKLSA